MNARCATVIFVGHARLPQSLGGSYGASMVSVELEAHLHSGIIFGGGG